MAIVEIQIRTDRFCDLVKSEINSMGLQSPTMNVPDKVKGKPLERIECLDCSLIGVYPDKNRMTLQGTLAIRYHESLETVRAAGSLKPATPESVTIPYFLDFDLTRPKVGDSPILGYKMTGTDLAGHFPLNLGGDIRVEAFALVMDDSIVAIRLGTKAGDPVHGPIVNHLGRDEWVQRIPGELVAAETSKALDLALDEVVKPPPPPDPNDPVTKFLKPKEVPKLHKEGSGTAAWVLAPVGSVIGNGTVVAEEACDIFDVDISIDITLRLSFSFPVPDVMVTTAILEWGADSTWCDVLAGLTSGLVSGVGFGVGLGIFISMTIEDEVSDTIKGELISPGGGFTEVKRDNDSITFSRSAVTPSPAPEFVLAHGETGIEGLSFGGPVSPKSAPVLEGAVIPATITPHINCSTRTVETEFDPARVVLWNAALPSGYRGPGPRVFLESTVVDPPGAWVVEAGWPSMSDPHNTSARTVLVFAEPPGSSITSETSGVWHLQQRTSAFIATAFGFRWVDLGPVPRASHAPSEWNSSDLVNVVCDAISNPWKSGLTPLGIPDPLSDPDPELRFEIDPVWLWQVGVKDVPDDVRIEFLAVDRTGAERRLGILQGRSAAALEVATAADETLAVRPNRPFAAPAPTVVRSRVFPFALWSGESEQVTIAAAGGLLGLSDSAGRMTLLDQQNLRDVPAEAQRSALHLGDRTRQIVAALQREEARGRHGWATAPRIDKGVVALMYRGKVLIGFVGSTRQIQQGGSTLLS